MAARYTLHGMHMSGPTYKVGLLLSLCGEAFDYVHVNLRAGEHKQPPFLAKNHFGQVPCLTDNETGRNFSQSAAILEYLADSTKKFRGTSPENRQRIREWMLWEYDRLAAPIFRMRAQRIGLRSFHQAVAENYVTDGNTALKVLDDALKGRSWLVGRKPTIADVDIYGVLVYAEVGGYVLKNYKNISAWKKRLEALPGFGLPDAVLPKESRKA